MRVLVVHNRYQQSGGEDNVVDAESHLLRDMGQDVEVWEEDNQSIVRPKDAWITALRCIHSFESALQMKEKIARFRPDLVHIHNFFPRLSPSIHRACFRAHIPVVQTLHNFRLLCPAATLQRNGKVCEDCLEKCIPWPSIRHACYRHSRAASAAVTNMLSIHRVAGSLDRFVTRYIALSAFSRNKFIQGGIDEEKIAIKPNFVDTDPGMGPGSGGFALFVGRLSEEKWIETLLNAWRQMARRPPLRIIGDGPLAPLVANAVATMREVEWFGLRRRKEVLRAMAEATVLVFPSTWYEGFPLVIAEAFATGLPVIASRLGAMEEIVESGKTGRLFTVGDSEQLGKCVEWAFSHDERIGRMRRDARFEFLQKYTARANFPILEEIYQSAMEDCRSNVFESVLQPGY